MGGGVAEKEWAVNEHRHLCVINNGLFTVDATCLVLCCWKAWANESFSDNLLQWINKNKWINKYNTVISHACLLSSLISTGVSQCGFQISKVWRQNCMLEVIWMIIFLQSDLHIWFVCSVFECIFRIKRFLNTTDWEKSGRLNQSFLIELFFGANL